MCPHHGYTGKIARAARYWWVGASKATPELATWLAAKLEIWTILGWPIAVAFAAFVHVGYDFDTAFGLAIIVELVYFLLVLVPFAYGEHIVEMEDDTDE